MTLRNVPKAHTLEQQRQEINLIASDLDTAVDGVKTFGGSKTFSGNVTFQSTVDFGGIALFNTSPTFNSSPTFSDNVAANFGDDADLKIYYDGSVGVLTSFIDSDALQIRSESDTSELYATFLKDGPVELYYNGAKKFGTNLTGATVLGDLEINDEIHSATGMVTFKVADEITPGNMITAAHIGGSVYGPYGLDTYNLSLFPSGGISETSDTSGFSVNSNGQIYISTGGASALWKGKQTGSTAVTSEINAQGNARFNGITQSSFLVNRNNTPTDGEGIELFYDSAASGGAAGGIQAYDRDNNALTRLKIRSSNWEIMNDGLATFSNTVKAQQTSNNALSAFEAVDTNGTRFKVTGAGVLSIYDNTLTENVTISSDGSATFAGQLGVNQTSVNSSRQMEITQPAGFTSGLRINSAGSSGDGAYYEVFVGSANYKFGGDHLTNALLFKKDGTEYMRHTSSGGIQLNNPNGDTSLSIGDPTNSEGRLILTSKLNTVEIHSRSNHPIEFLFNTTTKATLGINGDLSLDGGLTFTGQTSGSSATSDALDHYEEGTWTPTPLGLSNSPTYSNLKGRYVRIGSLVQVQGFIQMGSSPTWNDVNDFFMLGPLPFNYNADNAGYFATAGGVTCQNFNFHDNDYNNTGQVNCAIANSSSVSYVCFVVSDNNNTRGTVKNSAISGSDIIEFSLTYRAG